MAKQFVLPKLPYELNALEPVLSKETLEYHYGKHHATYITKLNELAAGDYLNMPIEDIIQRSDNGLYNSAAQSYNHTFYWYGMRPFDQTNTDNQPTGQIADAITEAFGDFSKFKESFSDTAVKHFGSGWAWLLKTKAGKLEVKGMHDADTPVKDGDQPLLALDVWEHAYYIDYRNKRPDYISAFWQVVNWEFVEKELLKPSAEPLMVTEDS